jgi:hypothetical protein
MHRRPSRTLSLVPQVSAVTVALILVLIALVAFIEILGKPETASQVSTVPTGTPASTASQSASQACEKAAVGALGRLALTLRQGGSADHAMAVERRQLDPTAYQAYSTVVNQFMEAEQVGRRQGVAAQVQTVLPQIRRACAETG